MKQSFITILVMHIKEQVCENLLLINLLTVLKL